MSIYVETSSSVNTPPINYSAVALEALIAIINNERSTTQDKLDAAKAMLDYLKL